MKKILFFCMLLFSLPAFSQKQTNEFSQGMTRAEWRKHMKAQKIIFYVEKMGLTETEKVAFNSLFAEFDKSLGESYAKTRKAKRELNQNSNEDEYRDVVDLIIDQSVVQFELRQKFLSDLKQIVSPQKIYRFFKAEKQFKNMLIRDIEKYRKVEKK